MEEPRGHEGTAPPLLVLVNQTFNTVLTDTLYDQKSWKPHLIDKGLTWVVICWSSNFIHICTSTLRVKTNDIFGYNCIFRISKHILFFLIIAPCLHPFWILYCRSSCWHNCPKQHVKGEQNKQKPNNSEDNTHSPSSSTSMDMFPRVVSVFLLNCFIGLSN